MLLMRGLMLAVVGSILLVTIVPLVLPSLRHACSQAALYGVTVGGVAFLAGFAGPILLAPGANQGPLLGIFFTGPLGFVAGTVGGFVIAVVRRPPARPPA